jgi:hypothetical protein
MDKFNIENFTVEGVMRLLVHKLTIEQASERCEQALSSISDILSLLNPALVSQATAKILQESSSND